MFTTSLILLGEIFSSFAIGVSERSGFPKINRTEMAEFETYFPTGEEQERIIEITNTLDKTIEGVRVTLSKLQSIKRGLMHDLLTGLVRG